MVFVEFLTVENMGLDIKMKSLSCLLRKILAIL